MNDQFGPLRCDTTKEIELCIPSVTVPATSALAPGSFVVTIKARLAAGPHFTRPGLYAFGADGSVRQGFWQWQSDDPDSGSVYGSSDRRIGVAVDDDYSLNLDQNDFMQGMTRFLGNESNLTVRYGARAQAGNDLRIDWASGDWEEWRLTWRDTAAALFKIELAAASFVTGPAYWDLRRSASPSPPAGASARR